jgi:phospholipid/cholesterol/gamma-HCH transport system ATP-binding protein
MHAEPLPTNEPSAAEPPPALRLVNLHKRFGSLTVLDGIGFDIPRGMTTVVMGPSGCGKSVLLKHIVGLLHPDNGEVWFEDKCISRMPEAELMEIRKRFGFLFQLAALFDSMTIYENVAFPLREHTDLKEDAIRRIVAEKLKVVELDGVQEKMPADLSGGMKKRAALARAIALDPEVVLYDEPTTGLDPQRSDVINTLINRLKERMHVTGICVTHDLQCVETVADRVVMLKGGKVRFNGTFPELKRTPDRELQAFITGKATESELNG